MTINQVGQEGELMIDMNVMTRDTVNLAFANHADFREVIKEVDKASEWKDYPSTRWSFPPLLV